MIIILIIQFVIVFFINICTRDQFLKTGILNYKYLPEGFWTKRKLMKKLYVVQIDKVLKGFLIVYIFSIVLFVLIFFLNILNWCGLEIILTNLFKKLFFYSQPISYGFTVLIYDICNIYYKHRQRNKILSINEKMNYFLNDRDERIAKSLNLKPIKDFLTFEEFCKYFSENENLVDFTFGECKIRLIHYMNKYSYQINDGETKIFDSSEKCFNDLVINGKCFQEIWNNLY